MEAKLLSSITSHSDLKAIIIEIKSYTKWYNQVEVKMKVTGSKDFELPSISKEATDIINSWVRDHQANQKSLDDLISHLEEFEATATRMTITLAAPPPNSLKHMLTDWCRNNIKQDILVDYNFNSTMLGGMVVKFGSHVYDWSFRRQILANREKFPEVLRRV